MGHLGLSKVPPHTAAKPDSPLICHHKPLSFMLSPAATSSHLALNSRDSKTCIPQRGMLFSPIMS